MTNDKTVTMPRELAVRLDSPHSSVRNAAIESLRRILAAPIVEADGMGEAVALQSQPAAIVDRKAICFLRLTDYGLTLPDGALLYASPPAPVAVVLDPCTWTDRQVLDFLGVALRNVDLVGEVRLSEIRQGFEYMRDLFACLDKVKELNQ